MTAPEPWLVVVAVLLLPLTGLSSLVLVIKWYHDAAPATRLLLDEMQIAFEAELRRLRYDWQRGRRFFAVSVGMWRVWRSYVAMKRVTLVGRIDLWLVWGVTGVVSSMVSATLVDIAWVAARRLWNL